MQHNDNAFATMLLTLDISPEKTDVVPVLNAKEFFNLSHSVKDLGMFLGKDVAFIRSKLDVSEEYAYRLCVLLGRTMALSFALEKLSAYNIDVVTCFDNEYPKALREKLGSYAPPCLYFYGNINLLQNDKLACVVAPTAVKLDTAIKETLYNLVKKLSEIGCVVVSGFDAGLQSLSLKAAKGYDTGFIAYSSCNMVKDIINCEAADSLAANNSLAISRVHPLSENKTTDEKAKLSTLAAISDFCFIFKPNKLITSNEFIKKALPQNIFVYNDGSFEANELISKGFTAFDNKNTDLLKLFNKSDISDYEQISMF